MPEPADERCELPDGAIVTANIEIVGYIHPEGEGGMSYAVRVESDQSRSSVIGLLEMAKQDVLENRE